MAKMIFLNLPVRDLAAATRFYEAIGCVKNEQFSDHQTSSMVWSDTITFHLMTHAYYGTFTSKPIADGRETSAMLIALTIDNREDVDAIVEAAKLAGGRADIREPQDMGFMYLRTFEDPDGHLFEPVWMNPDAMMGEQGAQ
ncbi:glyoxalase [Cupriavidus gilardii CR3]|uniref:Lactoylglutathione lyase n=1 Tax=Cupriavidus gilardii TaxID=82541 RepID=A0A849B7S6_9BURK|nr:VOC family protein [Cupriavidus gilardii]ALD90632.1 glyoxalase [Cupriavidus gilardii CR3]KAB0597936.1 lactoylglutathione lyase [Cupriavidus gilardii]MCT9015567.1 VOC family protein [Cupriavidus gilardii]MCT9055337.1 VOC family protein [Cupriavidus gilardii]NNH10506.1 lactoylglutathione lyase [Cupriavidus gilardii]